MTAREWLFGLAFAMAATGAIAQSSPTDPSEAAKKIAACEGEKFEFEAGEPRPTKITLCSDKDATTTDLVRMFESAAAKIEQLDRLAPDRRAALVAQLKAKISEVRARNAVITPLPAPVLPPETGPKIEYPQLPPLPAPVPMTVAAKPSPAPAIAITAPRLTLECTTPGKIGPGGPCIAFARDTLLTIRADETLPAGTSLRFLRRGNVRAEIALARMSKGQTRRIKLPADVCAGVVASKIEIQVVQGAGQIVDQRGPFELRC